MMEDGGQMSEVRSRRTDVRGQRTEALEFGSGNAECGKEAGKLGGEKRGMTRGQRILNWEVGMKRGWKWECGKKKAEREEHSVKRQQVSGVSVSG
jgi:hypothetical protein